MQKELTKESDHVIFRNHCAAPLLKRLVGDYGLVGSQLALEVVSHIGRQVCISLKQAFNVPDSLPGKFRRPMLGLLLPAAERPVTSVSVVRHRVRSSHNSGLNRAIVLNEVFQLPSNFERLRRRNCAVWGKIFTNELLLEIFRRRLADKLIKKVIVGRQSRGAGREGCAVVVAGGWGSCAALAGKLARAPQCDQSLSGPRSRRSPFSRHLGRRCDNSFPGSMAADPGR